MLGKQTKKYIITAQQVKKVVQSHYILYYNGVN